MLQQISSLIILILCFSPLLPLLLILLVLFLITIQLPHRFSSNKAPPSINSDWYHHEGNSIGFRETLHMTINYEIKLTTLKLLGICRNNGSDAFLSNQTQEERHTQTT